MRAAPKTTPLDSTLRAGALVLSLFAAALSGCTGEPESESNPDPEEGELRAPEHGPVPALPDVSDDPLAEAKAEVGRAMFHDLRLSQSGQTSCDRCHTAAASFQDNLATPVPDSSYPEGEPHASRNTTSMLNLVYAPIVRWDGSHTDVVESLVFPFAEGNMNLGADVPAAQIALKQRLTVDVPGYVPLFEGAFEEDIAAAEPAAVWRLAGEALFAFMRRAVSRDSDFDRWNAGDDGAMSESAVRGFDVFRGRGKCNACHTGPLFTDFSFHNVSSSPPGPSGDRPDEGRHLITGKEEDRGAFLTPTLRSVISSGPYFHDGSKFHMLQVLGHFSSEAVQADPNHDPVFDPPPSLDEDDFTDLMELLRALRGAPLGDEIGAPADLP